MVLFFTAKLAWLTAHLVLDLGVVLCCLTTPLHYLPWAVKHPADLVLAMYMHEWLDRYCVQRKLNFKKWHKRRSKITKLNYMHCWQSVDSVNFDSFPTHMYNIKVIMTGIVFTNLSSLCKLVCLHSSKMIATWNLSVEGWSLPPKGQGGEEWQEEIDKGGVNGY